MNENTNKDKHFEFDFLKIAAIFCYIAIIVASKIQFIPINQLNWFQLGMGKYVGIAAIFAIFSLAMKNYFAAFFISIFSAFFSFHELIIFYDNYAIELGSELGSDGAFRYVSQIFDDALKYNYGAFWAVYGSCFSLVFVLIGWVRKVFKENRLAYRH